MSQRFWLVYVAVVERLGVDTLCDRRGRNERGECQCGDDSLHGSLLRERCQIICRDIRKIIRWSAGTIKLPFRKLNSILCEKVWRGAVGADWSILGREVPLT